MLVFKLIIAGIPLLSLAWWMWADRRLRGLGAGCRWRLGLGLAVLLFMVGFAWVIAARREALPVPVTLYALVLLWSAVFLPLAALPTMLAWSLWSIGRAVVGRAPVRKKPAAETDGRRWTRREWLGATVLSLPVVATFGTAAYGLPRLSRLRIRDLTLFLGDLPAALDGMRIAHVTDTHVGKFTNGAMLEEIAAATNRLEADLVLFTGDLIDHAVADLPGAVAMLRRMTPGAGLFLVEGNHDLFDDPAAFRDGVRGGGLALLRNEVATVRVRGVPVQVLGIAWNHDERRLARDVDDMAALRDPAAFPILLAHHPHAFDRAAERGFPLTLSGHTHGGQLMLTPGIGAGPAFFRYWSGLYRKNGSALVVGNGSGNWFPLRVNAPAEIIRLTLRVG